MTPNEIIVDELRAFWAAPKLAEAILARLAAEGYVITHATAVTNPDVPTIVLGAGLVTMEPVAQSDGLVAGILFKQLSDALPINGRVSAESLAQAKPILQILSTKPQSFTALADISDQAMRLFSPVAAKE